MSVDGIAPGDMQGLGGKKKKKKKTERQKTVDEPSGRKVALRKMKGQRIRT